MCELFVGGGSTSATSVLQRRRYRLTVRGLLFMLRVGGLAVAGPYPTSTLIRSYPGEPFWESKLKIKTKKLKNKPIIKT